MPLILPGNVATATASTTYSIANSCRFNGVNGYLTRTNPGTSPTLATKGTLSFWMKRTGKMRSYTEGYTIYTHGAVAPYFQVAFNFTSSDCPGKLLIENNDNGSPVCAFKTTASYDDCGAWYHFCFTYDSTPSTPSSSSVKLFVNGVQVTAFDTEVYPVQNDVFEATVASSNYPIGHITGNFGQYYIAEMMQVDGQALNADSFGEFDEDSPTIWKPIDISGITVGNQGFYLDFSDADNLGTLALGTGDFTETNIDATDQATDTPTNNFAVVNPLDNYYEGSTFAEGNCKVTTKSGSYAYSTSTIGLTAGKWYWEIEINAQSSTDLFIAGIAARPPTATNNYLGADADAWGIYAGIDGYTTGGSDTSDWCDNFTDDDILMFALDLDNNKLYAGLNGNWCDGSGNFDESDIGDAAAINITAPASLTSGAYFAAAGYRDSSGTATYLMNFGGCPAFTISSAQSDDNSLGTFEFNPPTGYLSICTKNLGSDGG